LTNVIAVAAGYLHSAALLSNGTVVAWGDNSFGQTNIPAGLSNVVAIAAGDFHTFALRANGTVVGWGDNTYGQINVPSNLTAVASIASGNYHGLALTPTLGMLQTSVMPSALVMHWTGAGILQWAPTPTGPYNDIVTAGTSYTNTDMSARMKFFRLRH
jgi:alpha-tubulin suppressor-like RCC1 family protein